jgi:pyrroline-5-carboxylate reductase
MPQELQERLLSLLGALGLLVPIAEDLIDAAMAVMSCSPAYIARFAEALTRAGANAGLGPELAGTLVTATLAGTAELLNERDPAAIQKAVAPPGGATEAGLEALDRGGLENAVADAVTASLERFR